MGKKGPSHKILCHIPSPRGEQDTLKSEIVSKSYMMLMLMTKNPFYAAPEAEFLDVRFEGNILSGEGRPGGDEDYNDQGEF